MLPGFSGILCESCYLIVTSASGIIGWKEGSGEERMADFVLVYGTRLADYRKALSV